MFTPTKIQDCFKSLLGFRNDPDINVGQITDPVLLTTDSGLYYNDYHPLIRMDVIENIIPEGASLDTYLNEKVNQSSVKVLTAFSTMKKEMRSTKTIINSSAMFDGVGRLNNTVTTEGRFVGFEIKLAESYGVKTVIDAIGLQFTSPQTGLNIYLFHTSQVDPIKTITATTTKSGSFEFLSLSEPIELSYYNDTYDTGGFFYLGYFENDITGQAIKKDFNWSRGVCGSCTGQNAVKIWNTRLNFMSVQPCFVMNTDLNGTQIFDVNDVVISNDNNWGVNFRTTIKCDLSTYFCENKLSFVEAMGQQVAYDILNDIKHSDRANRIVEVNRNMVIRDLEGDTSTNEMGVAQKLKQAIKSLDFDFSKIDSPCLPCDKPSGVKVRSI